MPAETTGPESDSPCRSSAVSGVRAVVRRHELGSFFVASYAWSWGCWLGAWTLNGYDAPVFLAMTPGFLGPLFAAAAVTRATGGSVSAWARQATAWRLDPKWYVLAIGVVVGPNLVGSAVGILLAESAVGVQSPVSAAVTFVAVLLLGGALEEPGWRGFAHPRLRDRYGTLPAGALVGAIWAPWHLPLIVIGTLGIPLRAPMLAAFVAAIAATSVVLGWLYDGTGGSVFLAMVAHAIQNSVDVIESAADVPTGAEFASATAVVAANWLAVVGLVAAYGTWRFVPSPAPPPDDVGASTGDDVEHRQRA